MYRPRIDEGFDGLLISSTSSLHHQQLQRPFLRRLRTGLAKSPEREVCWERLTSSLLLSHLLGNLLLLALHLRTRHIIPFLL
jgi:hypothetical protein